MAADSDLSPPVATAIPESPKPRPPLSTFTLFPSLPSELRLKIWNLTIEPRIILSPRRFHLPIPSILHTCQESRQEALDHYQLLHNSPTDCNPVYFSIHHDILFSTSVDWIYGNWTLDIINGCPAIERACHIALPKEYWKRLLSYPVYGCLYERLRNSKALKSVSVVWNQGPLERESFRFVEEGSGGWPEEDEGTKEGYRRDVLESAGEHEGWNVPELRFVGLRALFEGS